MPVIRSVLALAAATLASAVLFGVPSPAGAAPVAPPERCRVTPDIATAAKASDVVVMGTVTKASTRTVGTKPNQRQVRDFVVDLDRTYRGMLTSSPITVRSVATARGLPAIPAGSDWVFFLGGSGDSFTAADCSGSREATAYVVRQVESELGAGKAWVDPAAEPDPLTYERVSSSAPLPLSRLVAPGLGVMLVGLLGLLVTRRRRG